MIDIFNTPPDNTEEALLEVQLGGFSFPVPGAIKTVFERLAEHGDGAMVHWVSRGQWSAIDLLLTTLALHEQPAEVWLSSYAFSERPARQIANLIEGGKISRLHALIDSRVDVRSQQALQLIKGCAYRLKMVDTHAKVTVVRFADHCYSIVGSANYTSNRRIEAGIITADASVANFHTDWLNETFDAAE